MSSYQAVPTTDEDAAAQPQIKPTQPSRFHRRHFFAVLGLTLIALTFYKLGQYSVENDHQTQLESSVKPIPDSHNDASNTTHTPTPEGTKMTGAGKYSVGYFVNWGIYGRKFPPSSIPANDLTHILYAFANISPGSGEVVLSDSWADTDIHYPGDSWSEPGTNLYGNFKAIYKIKQEHRHLKNLISIGGWTYSPSFHPVVIDPHKRQKFVQSSVKLLEDLGLDGLDIDYEYPTNDAEAKGYVDLLKELRTALDKHAKEKGADYHFLLTIAAPCGSAHYSKLHIKEMDRYLSFWNLMAYDFAGSWDQKAGHQSNLYPSSETEYSVKGAVDYYINKGHVAPQKLVIGIPLYGRSFMQTSGPGHSFQGVGPGSWEQGVYDYRFLPLPGSHVFRDEKAKASWGYDYHKKEMISFDTEEVGKWKGEWIKKRGLGGSMFWELSGDKEGAERKDIETGEGKVVIPGHSLVRVVKDAMGGIDHHQRNWLKYEQSKYENLREGRL